MIAGVGLGLVIGVLLGLLGGGGSILAVPALVYGAGCRCGGGADVAARRRRLLGHRPAAPAAPGAGGLAPSLGCSGPGAAAAFAGAAVNRLLDPRVVLSGSPH